MAFLGKVASDMIKTVTSSAVDLLKKGVEYVQGATTFSERSRSLEIEVINKTNNVLHLKKSHFVEGEWFTDCDLQDIKPGQKGFGRAANRQATLEGVKGSVVFEIGSTGMNFHIGFENPLKGDYKSFTSVDDNESAEWPLKQNSQGSTKNKEAEDYRLSCCTELPSESTFKKFIFTIKKLSPIFSERSRTLEIEINNETNSELQLKSSFFQRGEWFTSLDPKHIDPGEKSLGCAANRECTPEDVTAGVEFEIKNTELCFYIGFSNPVGAHYKTFIAVNKNGSAKWACERNSEDTDKILTNNGYCLSCSVQKQTEFEYKKFIFTIRKDVQILKIINATSDALLYKDMFMETKTNLVESYTIEASSSTGPYDIKANETKTIVITDSTGCLGKVAGGFKYVLEGKQLCLYFGFRRTPKKNCKTFMDINRNKSAEWACNEASNDDAKMIRSGYILHASIEDENQVFCYTIKKDIPENEKRLAFQINNKLKKRLQFKEKFFSSKTWALSLSKPSDPEIKRRQSKDVIITECQGLPAKINLGLEFEIRNTGLSLYIGFYKSSDGKEKHFMQVAQGKKAKWAAKKSLQDSDMTPNGRFQLYHKYNIEEQRTVFTYIIENEIPENEQRLALKIINATPQLLIFKEKFFSSKTWVISHSEPPDSEIKPRDPKDIIVAELRGLPSEIKVGLEFKIKNTILSLYIGFYKSPEGEEKHFKMVTNNKTVQWAAQQYLANSENWMQNKTFKLGYQCKEESQRKTYEYTIINNGVSCGCLG